MPDSSFSHSELRQALSEIGSWGIESARILDQHSAEGDKATAQLTLLEGLEVTVECSESGWRLNKSEPLVKSLEADLFDRNFDTLDDLLLAVSPRFEQKRMEKLFEKLSDVANERREAVTGDEGSDIEYGNYDDGSDQAHAELRG
ncbi:hypothetical protein JCM5350_003203 [Sporobolomyces pararoseus]